MSKDGGGAARPCFISSRVTRKVFRGRADLSLPIFRNVFLPSFEWALIFTFYFRSAANNSVNKVKPREGWRQTDEGRQTETKIPMQTVDEYLESIALPSTFTSEIGAPVRQATVSMSSNIRASLDWFIESP